jgi:hypothetical protein
MPGSPPNQQGRQPQSRSRRSCTERCRGATRAARGFWAVCSPSRLPGRVSAGSVDRPARGDLDTLLSGHDPADGSWFAGRARTRNAGFDLTFTAPKPVSVLAALGDTPTRAEVRRPGRGREGRGPTSMCATVCARAPQIGGSRRVLARPSAGAGQAAIRFATRESSLGTVGVEPTRGFPQRCLRPPRLPFRHVPRGECRRRARTIRPWPAPIRVRFPGPATPS